MSCVSYKDNVEIQVIPENTQEYTELMKFCNDETVNVLESKKSGNLIFSKYRKDTKTGLIVLYKDSIIFINDVFFLPVETEYQRLDFIDSLRISFTARQNFANKTVNYKYLFHFSDVADKWLLEYAEKNEFTAGQSVYLFTDDVPENFSMDNFSAEKSSSILFMDNSRKLFSYKYKTKQFLDSIEIQVSALISSNVTAFKHVFTVDHAEKILLDYPLSKTTVTPLNNIAYYLEQISITMPAILILETVITDFPNRIVAYRNLSDALTKNNLKVKAEKIYNQYTKLKTRR
jgi:hypothetical protein